MARKVPLRFGHLEVSSNEQQSAEPIQLVSCPDPALSQERVRRHKPESLGLRKC